MALAVSLGYSGQEIENLIGQTVSKKIQRWKFFVCWRIWQSKEILRLVQGEKNGKMVRANDRSKNGKCRHTFEQLHQKGFRDLYEQGPCLNKQRPGYFLLRNISRHES
jgi:hypothetical protein